MKSKQIMGILVAGIVFIAVCSFGVYTNYLKEKNLNQNSNVMSLLNLQDTFDFANLPMTSYVGLVRVEGTIMETDASGWLSTTGGYDHKKTLDYIDKMKDDDNNKGILLFVNSPGGGVYESDELYLKLMDYKEATGRPIWTYMSNQACSGGYYISMASDKVRGNRNGYTGSIGVIVSLTDLTGLYEKLGIEEINITSGKNKAMGSSGEELTEEQRGIFQSIVDEAYGQFVEIVAMGRNMTVDQVKELADGRIFTMKQAVDNGLVDEVGEYQETVDALLNETGSAILYEPNQSKSWLSTWLNSINEVKPKSEAEVLTSYLEKVGNGVPMYYAEP